MPQPSIIRRLNEVECFVDARHGHAAGNLSTATAPPQALRQYSNALGIGDGHVRGSIGIVLWSYLLTGNHRDFPQNWLEPDHPVFTSVIVLYVRHLVVCRRRRAADVICIPRCNLMLSPPSASPSSMRTRVLIDDHRHRVPISSYLSIIISVYRHNIV